MQFQLCCAIVTIPPILLFVYPVYYKIFAHSWLGESRFFNFTSRYVPLAKLKSFLDSFQSCFKDNCHFFAGLYFVYRLVWLATASVATSFTLFYSVMEVELIRFLSFHALAQPYEKRWHNILDNLLFTNLAIINGLTLYNYTRVSDSFSPNYQRNIDIISSIQLVLIYLPMVYMVGYVTCHFLSGIKGTLLARKLKNSTSNLSQPQDDTELPARLIYSDCSDSQEENLDYH